MYFALATGKGFTQFELLSDPSLLINADKLGISRNYVVMGLFGIFLIAFWVFVTCVRKFHRKTLTSVLTGYDRFRFRRFWFAFAVWAVLVLITFFVDLLTSPESYTYTFSRDGFSFSTVAALLGSVVIMLICVPFQSGFEESFFRGYAMQGLAQAFRNGIIPLLITSVLFGLVHMDNPEVKKYGAGIMLLYYSCFGLFLGAITLLDEGLELALGIHIANNLVSSILVTSDESALKTYSLFTTGSGNAYIEFVVWIVCALITFLILMRRYRWKNFSLLVK
jgi:uncharacterized protein